MTHIRTYCSSTRTMPLSNIYNRVKLKIRTRSGDLPIIEGSAALGTVFKIPSRDFAACGGERYEILSKFWHHDKIDILPPVLGAQAAMYLSPQAAFNYSNWKWDFGNATIVRKQQCGDHGNGKTEKHLLQCEEVDGPELSMKLTSKSTKKRNTRKSTILWQSTLYRADPDDL